MTRDEVIETIEQSSEELHREMDELSRRWLQLYWTLQIRGNDLIRTWTVSGIKHRCPIEQDEVAATVTLDVRQGSPLVAVDLWFGATHSQSLGELTPTSADELASFLRSALPGMVSSLDAAAQRLLATVEAASSVSR